jgi:inner membrane protein involved in colicin E2 resistance
LLSEDYALLMGSALLFLLLAVTMVKTRHIDWDNLGQLTEDKER